MTRDTSHTENAGREPMREVSHTNPYTNESMGSLFEHGVTVVADGGERDAVDDDGTPVAGRDRDGDAAADAADDAESADAADDAESADAAAMKNVSHEAPEGGHGNRMFERVGDTADVEDEE